MMHKLAKHYYSLGKQANLSRAAKGALLGPLLASPLVKKAPEFREGVRVTEFADELIDGFGGLGKMVMPSLSSGPDIAAGIALTMGAGAGAGKLLDIALNKARLKQRLVDQIEQQALGGLRRPAVRQALKEELAMAMPKNRDMLLTGLLAGGALGAGSGYLAAKK
jgi:hypothetical protein